MTDRPTDFVFDSNRIKWNTPEDKAAFEASGGDWATEMAGKAVLKLHWEHKHDCEIIAQYLRKVAIKAKADGMREAAQLCVSDLGEGDIDFIAFKLRLEADKLETSTE